MTIQTSKFSKKQQAYNNTLSSLKDMTQNKNLPPELMSKLQETFTFFQAYDMNQHRDALKALTGPILTQDEVKAMVVDATGYTKWSIEPEQEEMGWNHEYFANQYGIEVANQDIVTYLVARNTNSRNDIFLIRVICLPGHTYLFFDTGRVGWGAEKIIKNNKTYETIESIFNSN